ncbi:MAG: T9SS type A sorting domain-containing protein, partial [Dinghuibacter sp.]|nr:T9SS type A sorting domain-containing protein [Dinghuibacter sp.]
DIAFDASGNMHIGLRDRFGDMVGDGVNEPGGSATLLESDGNGDILRAVYNAPGSWTMNMTEATHGTEFYAGDEFGGQHQETCNGGLAIQSGTGQVVYTVMDPVSNLSSGLDWANTTTGALVRSYQVHRRNSGAAATDYYFAKSNGNGDVECLSDAAPVEIGNRVWNDADADGVQDASEAGIPNVTIELFTDFNLDAIPDGPAIASVVTNANGEWYFGSTNITDGDPFTAGNQPGFKYGKGYIARIAASDWLMGPGNGINDLAGLQLTIPDASSTGETDLADNDAWLTNGGTIVPQIIILPMATGQNNFDYDFGFTALSFLPVKFTSVQAEKINNTQAEIKWSVANEEPRMQYTIERSADGIQFNAIGTVQASGASAYRFTDVAPITQTKNYYRIRQTDASGRVVNSEIRWVRFDGEVETEIYPNPVVNQLNIVLNETSGNTTVTAALYSMNGKQVKRQQLARGVNKIDVSLLPAGTYQLVVLNGNEVSRTQKIVKQ